MNNKWTDLTLKLYVGRHIVEIVDTFIQKRHFITIDLFLINSIFETLNVRHVRHRNIICKQLRSRSNGSDQGLHCLPLGCDNRIIRLIAEYKLYHN